MQFPKKGPRLKWIIYKHVSEKFKKCLSVGNSGILTVVSCLSVSSLLPTPVYVEVWNIY